ncbi:MAG: response regulator transcription factor [Anaerolineae bacterium]|nr:response regulator transcription factor [Anaerolineae bacterium]
MSEHIPNILVADDDPDLRRIMIDYLMDCGYRVWSASDGEQVLALARENSIDFALLDVVMPKISGVELIVPLRLIHPGVIIILLTAYGTIPQAVEALRLGAFDYLEKPLQLERMQEIIERAWGARGGYVQMLKNLTPREQEIIELLTEGKTNGEISDILCISMYTVTTHVHNILTKLNVENRIQAALLWRRYGGSQEIST